jgi:tetratricopeptide (TPR) repeat protein
MNHEPKAGQGLDPEMLAAYIEKRLSPEQRAAVEAQLAADPDSYAVLVESMKTLDALEDRQVPAQVPEAPEATRVPVVPFVPKKALSRRWVIAGGALAAAAAVLLIVRLDVISLFGPTTSMDDVVDASHGIRRTSGRLSGGFAYAPVRAVRGSGNGALAADEWDLLATAADLERQPQPRDASVDHALGVTYLLLRRIDSAVEALQRAAAGDASPEIKTDLAVALLERYLADGNRADLDEATRELDSVLAIAPSMSAALFTRAAVLTRLGDARSAEAWESYLKVDSSSGWAQEAREHLEQVR